MRTSRFLHGGFSLVEEQLLEMIALSERQVRDAYKGCKKAKTKESAIMFFDVMTAAEENLTKIQKKLDILYSKIDLLNERKDYV